MTFDITERQSGKTTRIINEVNKIKDGLNYVIVTMNKHSLKELKGLNTLHRYMISSVRIEQYDYIFFDEFFEYEGKHNHLFYYVQNLPKKIYITGTLDLTRQELSTDMVQYLTEHHPEKLI